MEASRTLLILLCTSCLIWMDLKPNHCLTTQQSDLLLSSNKTEVHFENSQLIATLTKLHEISTLYQNTKDLTKLDNGLICGEFLACATGNNPISLTQTTSLSHLPSKVYILAVYLVVERDNSYCIISNVRYSKSTCLTNLQTVATSQSRTVSSFPNSNAIHSILTRNTCSPALNL